MRGFQIWSQNKNPMTFTPLFGQKQSKTVKIPYFVSFRQFLGQKWGQVLSNFNSEYRSPSPEVVESP